jgi:hypothetical protein
VNWLAELLKMPIGWSEHTIPAVRKSLAYFSVF